MKKSLVFFILIFTIAALHSTNVAGAKPVSDASEGVTAAQDSVGGMTDEQFRAYEDSLLRTLYPEVKECHLPDSVLQKIQDDGAAVIQLRTDNSQRISNPAVPDAVTIDRTCAIGGIEIRSGVTPTGARTYEVPINVCPGMNGFQPAVSLVYNSQGGSSAVGQGWAVSGFPMITRGGKNHYYDGTSEGVRMDLTDSFYLDGVRLIKTADATNGVTAYETEVGNVRVKGYGTDTVATYFEASFPDGRKAVFGYTGNTGNMLEYPVSSMTDIHGNRIIYFNVLYGNRYYPERMIYKGGMVEFSYAARRDTLTCYAGGLDASVCDLLKSVSCYGNTKIGEYGLSHSLHNGVSHLSGISYSAGEESFNPLRFIYGEGKVEDGYNTSVTRLVSSYTSEDPRMVKAVRGRFDCGSYDDGLIVLPNKNPYWQHHKGSGIGSKSENRYDNLYTGEEKIFVYGGLAESFADPLAELVTGKGFIDIFCADMEGNGEDYVIKVNDYVEGWGADAVDRVMFSVYRPDTLNGLAKLYSRSHDESGVFTDESGGRSIQPKFYYPGDFDGDGRSEILCVYANLPFGPNNGHPSQCILFDLRDDRVLYSGHPFDLDMQFVGNDPLSNNPESVYNNSDRLLVFDADGDGKTDICIVKVNGVHIYSFNKTEDGSLDVEELSSGTALRRSVVRDRELIPGDFNGDGLTDLLLSPWKGTSGDNNQWRILYSTGNGGFKVDTFNGTGKGQGTTFPEFFTQDVDSDGRSDLIKYSPTGFDTYLSTPGGPGVSAFLTQFPSVNSVIVPIDVNSRNSTSSLMALNGTAVTMYSSVMEKSREQLLTGMVNSLGQVEKNEYRSLCDTEGAVYEYSGKSHRFPYVRVRTPMLVLSRAESCYGTQVCGMTDYGYEDAVFHRQGLGFMGFSKVRSLDSRGNLTVRTYDPYSHGVLKSVESPSSKTVNTYSVEVKPNKVKKILLDKKTEEDLLTGYSADYSYTYDQYGYPLTETATHSDGITVKTELSYGDSPETDGAYSLGFVTDRTVTTTRDGDTYVERTHFPEHASRQPLTAVRYVNGNQVERIDYTYDDCGNVTKEKVTPYDSPNSLTSEYSYTDTGQLATETDPWGLSKTYSYGSNGRLSAISDYTGTTSIQYDPFGRETSRKFPDNTVRITTYGWTPEGTPGVYTVTTGETGRRTVSESHDALGRAVRTCDTRFDGKIRKTDREYDTHGDLARESLPFTGQAASEWTEYEYDTHGRTVAVYEPSGRFTHYSYDGPETITTKDGVDIRRGYDSQGNLTLSSDDSGDVTYNLAADGQPSSVVSPGGIYIWLRYDRFRRHERTEDSGYGVIRYEYDSWGNVSKRTCGGKATAYGYDGLNRLVKTVTPEFTTTYSYDGYNRPVSVSSDNGTSLDITYDAYGREASRLERGTDGVWLRRDITYVDGNIRSIEYATQSGLRLTERHIYSQGTLAEGWVDAALAYRLDAEDSDGLPIRIQIGGVSREYSYSHGLPAKRLAWRENGDCIQDLRYGFDAATSCLTGREDRLHGLSEEFTYDNLSRLVSDGAEEFSYNPWGNVTGRSGVGAFEYGIPNRPHAITGIVPSGDNIPLHTQEISYTSFSRPQLIKEGEFTASFTYNGDYDRVRMSVMKGEDCVLDRHYLGGCYERDATDSGNSEKLYLFGDYYDAPLVYVTQNGEGELCHILRDYLGSVTHVLDADGNILQEKTYGAWGTPRDPETLEPTGGSQDDEQGLYLGRGFTGHEHLPWFGLINMNARLYDPLTCRFLSPDPQVQMPDFTQGLNRFSYALNNPFMYVDQDGEFLWYIVGAAAIGGIINVATHWDAVSAGGFWTGMKYFATGAVAGGVGAVAGIGVAGVLGGTMGAVGGTMGFLGGMTTSATFGASSGFILGTGNSLIEGESFGHSLVTGLEQGLIDGVLNGIGGGIGGGVKALNRGRNFWTGKYSNEALVYRAGLLAKKNIEGSGAVIGTKRHTYATKVLRKYQKIVEDRGLKTDRCKEYAGRKWKPDVVDERNNIIYDWKFGYPNKTAEQLNQTRQMRMYREAFRMDLSKIFKYEVV
ncbi:RHS repeat-associated core domain-containing protein [uncultured Duncaniella sp.]|uniref:RHS repeat-associated core domain-containing protein n=1 Tax=uncultured Duncaniella sp. TaxID=2768039 RepID=UPI00261B93BA|nr:RHS repeat-associated core domain-containing protein [uncultured Duncaniella sp.]